MSKNGHVYTPNETRAYEKLIADEWRKQVPGSPLLGPCTVRMTFVFKRPQSHLRASGTRKDSAPLYHQQTPDLDNIEKAVLDGLNGVAFKDDKQVFYKNTQKQWGHSDGIVIEVVSTGEPIGLLWD